VLANDERLVTSDHVLVETWLLLARRLGRHTAETFWQRLRAGGATVELVSAADLEAAFAIGDAFADQDFSIVDRTSFAVMERLGIFRAATLDEHFAVYRFGRNRSRAFEIVR
jgi:predicted nucleic acid-binding protein